MKRTEWAINASVVVTTLVDISLYMAGVNPLVGQPINDSLALLGLPV